MYNFYGYFISVYVIVFGLIILWFAIQFRSENRFLTKTSNSKELNNE